MTRHNNYKVYEKGLIMYSRKDEQDWEINSEGLYVATRGYLIRRGYCCANKCRNCPYVNWHNHIEWQPIPAEYIKRMRVSIKSVAGAQARLAYHQQKLQTEQTQERIKHQVMVEHYTLLLERWGCKKTREDD